MNRFLLIVASMALLSSCATCAAGSSRPLSLARFVANPATSNSSGAPMRVDLLARSFLVKGEDAQPGFAYYSYVIFADRADSTFEARREASIKLMQLFDDVESVTDANVPHNRMAVLYAPVKSERVAAACVIQCDPKIFLDDYDYARARLLLNVLQAKTDRELPRVFLVGHPVPIHDEASIIPDEAYIVDLSAGQAGEAEARLLVFRDRLETSVDELGDVGTPTVLIKARAFFALIGRALKQAAEIPAAAAGF